MITKHAEVRVVSFNKIELWMHNELVEDGPLSMRDDFERSARLVNMMLHALKVQKPVVMEPDSYVPVNPDA